MPEKKCMKFYKYFSPLKIQALNPDPYPDPYPDPDPDPYPDPHPHPFSKPWIRIWIRKKWMWIRNPGFIYEIK